MAQTSAVCHSKNLDRPTNFLNEELINWYIVTTLGQVNKVDKIVIWLDFWFAKLNLKIELASEKFKIVMIDIDKCSIYWYLY